MGLGYYKLYATNTGDETKNITTDDMGYTLEDVLSIGIEKVKNRQKKNTIHGNGDNQELI